MDPFGGLNPSAFGQSIGTPIGATPAKPIQVKKNPQNFLTGFASKLLPSVLAPGVSAITNRGLIQQAIQGSPSALSQTIINVGGAAAGLPGAALIGADQLLKRTLGKGIVSGTEDQYRNNLSMPGMGRQGFGGSF